MSLIRPPNALRHFFIYKIRKKMHIIKENTVLLNSTDRKNVFQSTIYYVTIGQFKHKQRITRLFTDWSILGMHHSTEHLIL